MSDEAKGWLIFVLFLAGVVGWIYLSGDSTDSSQNTTPELKQSSQSPAYNPPTFHGDTCTFDCSGHEAGYDWAEEQGITDPDDCGGNSDSFIEGCQTYAEENGY